MSDSRSPLARAAAAVARAVVLPMVNGALRHSPTMLREYVFREAALSLGVSTVTCDGELGRFEGDIRDRVIHAVYVATKQWAPEFHALARRVFAGGGGTLVDVGANIGLTSVPVAKAFSVRCHSFEPHPANFALLKRNAQANGVASLVAAHNLAVMDADGVFELEVSADNMGDHRIRVTQGRGEFGEQARVTVKVDARRLDAVLGDESLEQPVLLKVDTQGAEVRVLRGATRVLREADVVFLEYWPYGLRRMGDVPDALFDAIAGFPYGGIVSGDEVPALEPIRSLLARVRAAIPVDGSAKDHLDLVLARKPQL